MPSPYEIEEAWNRLEEALECLQRHPSPSVLAEVRCRRRRYIELMRTERRALHPV